MVDTTLENGTERRGEKSNSSALVMLQRIEDGRINFIRDTGKVPSKIHMTKEEMKELGNDLLGVTLYSRERDLKERLRPDLLPPMRETPEVTEGGMIYGTLIIETDSPGLHYAT